MEEKAKSGLKSAMSFLKGDVLFYLAEAEKHETDTTERLRIHLIKEAAEELSERIKTATEQEKTRERCGRCAHSSDCGDVFKYVVPCVRFEKRQDLRQEEAERMYEVTSDIHRKRVKDIETDRLPPRRWGEIRMN